MHAPLGSCCSAALVSSSADDAPPGSSSRWFSPPMTILQPTRARLSARVDRGNSPKQRGDRWSASWLKRSGHGSRRMAAGMTL
ncbi:hypothetical protein CHLRE_02g115567v5 [Chlamydomonas reinhardtii]|uniref:Uncharacterized protein n=1 Tax=Chlamydomonas reinhardtii TaxID=3055 RepID=A0A2K3E3C7_CHLRE|nr:uncharacterized protein CHLRE_02g115567v5 [Chlamydomonas reinhardtii]PNW87263.1 hypothetical protein CHLRE_02g115567v5 [Chlamydomonas reinhardtii]